MKDVKAMTTAELITEYNQLTNKNTKRFASRAAGEKAVTLARERSQSPRPTGDRPEPKRHDTVSNAVSKSWKNNKTRAQRIRRDNVMVNGEGPFRSVAAAFKHFKLPMNKHVKFRADVKANGAGKFIHNETNYNFKVVAGE